MALPPINIVLKATTDGFRRGVSVVDGQLDKIEGSANSLQKRLITTGDRLRMVGRRMSIITGAATGAGAAMFGLAVSAARAGDAIGDSAKAAGMSTTAFQEYRFALKEAADMTDEEFAGSMVKLNKTLGEAREGSKSAVAAFEAIGVSQAQIADGSFDTDAALKAFVARMEETTDPTIAAAMAADLFGKSGARIGAGLSGVPGQVGDLVAQARELGIVLGPDTIKQAGEVDAKIKALGEQFEATKVKIGTTLLPFLNDTFLPFLANTVIPGIGDVIEMAIGLGKAFTDLPGPVQTAVELIAVAIGVGGPIMMAIGALSTALAALFAGPAAPLVLAAAAIVALSALWPAFGTAAHDAFVILGGSVVGAIKLIFELIKAVGLAEQAIVDLFVLGVDNRRDPANAGRVAGDTEAGAFNTGNMGGTGGSNSSDTGANIANGTINGFVATMDARAPEITAAMERMAATARAAVGVQSPSTVFAEIGQCIGQGLAQGIASTSGIVNAAVGAMGQGAVGSSNAMVSSILGSLDTLFAGSQKAGAALALVNMFVGMSQEIRKGTFGFASMLKVAAQGMTIVKGIKGAKSGGGAGVGSSGGGGAAAAAPQQAVQTMNFHVSNDPFGFGERMIRQIATQMNEASRNGMNIRASVVS